MSWTSFALGMPARTVATRCMSLSSSSSLSEGLAMPRCLPADAPCSGALHHSSKSAAVVRVTPWRHSAHTITYPKARTRRPGNHPGNQTPAAAAAAACAGGDGQLLRRSAARSSVAPAVAAPRRTGRPAPRPRPRRRPAARGSRSRGWSGSPTGTHLCCLFGEDPEVQDFVRGPTVDEFCAGTCACQLSLYGDPGLTKVLPGPTVA